jgi:hypothetical protein
MFKMWCGPPCVPCRAFPCWQIGPLCASRRYPDCYHTKDVQPCQRRHQQGQQCGRVHAWHIVNDNAALIVPHYFDVDDRTPSLFGNMDHPICFCLSGTRPRRTRLIVETRFQLYLKRQMCLGPRRERDSRNELWEGSRRIIASSSSSTHQSTSSSLLHSYVLLCNCSTGVVGTDRDRRNSSFRMIFHANGSVVCILIDLLE